MFLTSLQPVNCVSVVRAFIPFNFDEFLAFHPVNVWQKIFFSFFLTVQNPIVFVLCALEAVSLSAWEVFLLNRFSSITRVAAEDPGAEHLKDQVSQFVERLGAFAVSEEVCPSNDSWAQLSDEVIGAC
eukprot:TRINITY_DN6627_c1_g3_i1.p3 TRINITY_DN6627_c1_g3~~TRINITY_DN6627_c1_g3_i1.p3  ORF type:complete len:128 (-),score=8.41 TRINITY_DN6627_c1_g3_i1:154-537(-)